MIKTYIAACLAKTSFMRMTPEEGLSHPWTKGWGFMRKSYSNMAGIFDPETSEDTNKNTPHMSSFFKR